MAKNIFMISGEESGDKHGAALIAALKGLDPSLTVKGMGGSLMRAAGLTGIDSREVSVVGITEVLSKSPVLLKAFNELKRLAASQSFDAVILIDFPDFNLRFAKEARKLSIPVIYYISPQVWAWRRSRIKKIARLVDKMLVVFPFEEALYREAGVDVEYVGHPLLDSAVCPLTRDEARRRVGLEPDATVVALLPGSRTAEIKRHLPVMLGAATLIGKGLPSGARFVMPAADTVDDGLIQGLLKDSKVEVKVVRNEFSTAVRAADAAIVASGTATLEAALIGTPMVIIYRMSPLTYGIARLLVRVEFIGLPNIVAGRKVVEELIQGAASPEGISTGILEILRNTSEKDDIISGYEEIRRRLGSTGAARRAAQAVYRVITARA